MQNNILKTALIGVGNMGRKYAEMITAGEVPHMKLTAVVIRRDELMEWGKSLVNTDGEKVKIFRSAEELFAAEAENINVNIIGNLPINSGIIPNLRISSTVTYCNMFFS